MNLKTIRDAQNLTGKRVLVRADFDIPIQDGMVMNDMRLRAALPTIEFLRAAKAKIILLAHLGRPKSTADKNLRLDPIAVSLSELLGIPVKKLDDCVGVSIEAEIAKMQPGEVILLENTRFHAGEEKNDPEFVVELARLGDVFVNDAFATAHRAHASNFGLAQVLPSYAGLSLEKEVQSLSAVLANPKKPLCLILGGAKIDTKIGVLRQFVTLADTILLGGGIANTFLAAKNFAVGASLYEPEKLETAREILALAEKFDCRIVLPSDAICAPDFDSPSQTFLVAAISPEQKMLDIGPESIRQFSEIIARAGTVVWNGPVGVFEQTAFAQGTRAIVTACATTSADTILGGGDTLAALAQFKIPLTRFTHVSTGGGAMLELLENKKLPVLAILEK